MPGELKLIPAPYELVEIKLNPGKGLDVGAGRNESLSTKIYGGVVGIILDGRGRLPFNLAERSEERVLNLSTWSKATNEYPSLEYA